LLLITNEASPQTDELYRHNISLGIMGFPGRSAVGSGRASRDMPWI
jgi:hypothetical protein